MLRLFIAISLIVASCSTGETPTTAPPVEPPEAVVSEWLQAVAAIDVATLVDIVEPTGLAVIAGVENRLQADDLAAILSEGLQGEQARSYWQTFRDDFAAIRGVAISDLAVGQEISDGPPVGFTAVTVTSDGSPGRVVLRRSSEQRWQVDMVATVGAGLIGPLADYLVAALDGEQGQVVSDAYRLGVIPGLDAAVALDPSNADLVFETEFIRQLVP